ncbi:hypothetical protein [Halanaerobium sp. ST460_2HS_T2]|uniref:hypothetical protein n=1 Tax=Halanaerobium sp. ST460_2HS_T2 TaxID=2183914 RepID=UPI000DF358BB|nr:hypothetical protein [Halanaerobium sp. ST460_2HS_T2]RCW58583.1 hypothetical protein DFR80_1105 [Halanaerobium sp. ST460_2HS_T2]
MALANVEGPKYNEKVEYILQELGKGRSREDLAAEYDYSNYKSLDIYLRRRGFRYDSEKENYVPDLPEEEVVVPENANSKVTLIITMFIKENADPKKIAESAGFEDHREMANYMQRQGYSWSTTQQNYRPAKNKGVEEEKEDDSGPESAEVLTEKKEMLQSSSLQKFIPLLQKLQQKEEELFALVDGNSDGTVPKYAVPGQSTTKSIYMSKSLAHFLEEFSDVKNLSQREIVEAALVQFLKQYGFKTEMETLLSS